MCVVNKFRSGKGLAVFKLLLLACTMNEVVVMVQHVFVGADHKAKGSAGRVVAFFAKLRFYKLCHYID